MKIKINKPYFKRYRRVSKECDKLSNAIHNDDSYSLWFNVLPVIEVMYFSYGRDHRYNQIEISLEWLFWGVTMKVEFDEELL